MSGRWSIDYVHFGGIGGSDTQLHLDGDGSTRAYCPESDGRYRASPSEVGRIAELLDLAAREGAMRSRWLWKGWKTEAEQACDAAQAAHQPSCECYRHAIDFTYQGRVHSVRLGGASVDALIAVIESLKERACAVRGSRR
jgi:hypothetical protein